jgi:hypothetical protein
MWRSDRPAGRCQRSDARRRQSARGVRALTVSGLSVALLLQFPLRTVAFAADEAARPRLTALQFSEHQIDTTSSAADFTIGFTATGSSGVNYFEAVFTDAFGIAHRSASRKFAASTFLAETITINFPRFGTAGVWTLSRVFLSDAGGNTLSLDAQDLIRDGFPTRLEVRSQNDTVKPRLEGLQYEPVAIDTKTGPANVEVRYTATDDLSGVSYIELTFVSPSGTVRRGGLARLDPTRNTSGSIRVPFPSYSEAGTGRSAR